MLVATPSGISLGPEGGAHQSIFTPLIGIGHANLASFEPAFADELAVIMSWGFDYMQKPDGSSVYLRLSTRPLEQPDRTISPALEAGILAGAYWVVPPVPHCDLVLVYSGVVAPEAMAAFNIIREDVPNAAMLAITSADRLLDGLSASARARKDGRPGICSPIEQLLSELSPEATLVTVHDSHPLALGWLGSVHGHRCEALGVERFGQAGNIADLYREYELDSDAIVDAVADIIVQQAGITAPLPLTTD